MKIITSIAVALILMSSVSEAMNRRPTVDQRLGKEWADSLRGGSASRAPNRPEPLRRKPKVVIVGGGSNRGMARAVFRQVQAEARHRGIEEDDFQVAIHLSDSLNSTRLMLTEGEPESFDPFDSQSIESGFLERTTFPREPEDASSSLLALPSADSSLSLQDILNQDEITSLIVLSPMDVPLNATTLSLLRDRVVEGGRVGIMWQTPFFEKMGCTLPNCPLPPAWGVRLLEDNSEWAAIEKSFEAGDISDAIQKALDMLPPEDLETYHKGPELWSHFRVRILKPKIEELLRRYFLEVGEKKGPAISYFRCIKGEEGVNEGMSTPLTPRTRMTIPAVTAYLDELGDQPVALVCGSSPSEAPLRKGCAATVYAYNERSNPISLIGDGVSEVVFGGLRLPLRTTPETQKYAGYVFPISSKEIETLKGRMSEVWVKENVMTDLSPAGFAAVVSFLKPQGRLYIPLYSPRIQIIEPPKCLLELKETYEQNPYPHRFVYSSEGKLRFNEAFVVDQFVKERVPSIGGWQITFPDSFELPISFLGDGKAQPIVNRSERDRFDYSLSEWIDALENFLEEEIRKNSELSAALKSHIMNISALWFPDHKIEADSFQTYLGCSEFIVLTNPQPIVDESEAEEKIDPRIQELVVENDALRAQINNGTGRSNPVEVLREEFLETPLRNVHLVSSELQEPRILRVSQKDWGLEPPILGKTFLMAGSQEWLVVEASQDPETGDWVLRCAGSFLTNPTFPETLFRRELPDTYVSTQTLEWNRGWINGIWSGKKFFLPSTKGNLDTFTINRKIQVGESECVIKEVSTEDPTWIHVGVEAASGHEPALSGHERGPLSITFLD